MAKMTIIGDSPPVKAMLQMINRVAGTKTNILVIGESGTGKELVARLIHDSGPLASKPFVPVNCGAIPENLIESEMFGHRKGSFTGAVSEKAGLFEVASAGTLFLDEVGELPLSMQVKMLRAIQERTIRRVGGTEDIKVDVRIIAATNRDLELAVKAGTFREDLYYRLNVIQIRTPPLRERKTDIPTLVDHFIRKISAKFGREVIGINPETVAYLVNYHWPGNVRELENVIERAVALENSFELGPGTLPQAIKDSGNRVGMGGPGTAGGAELAATAAALSGAGALNTGTLSGLNGAGAVAPSPGFDSGPVDLDAILNGIEKTYLLAALEKTGGVKKKAADLLGITFRSIRYRLKKLGVDSGDTEGDAGEEGLD